jgi:hypothetical protein
LIVSTKYCVVVSSVDLSATFSVCCSLSELMLFTEKYSQLSFKVSRVIV